jgi:prolyl-tRNA editing enzyme YbaK/EbsC (Cys-tRNA(Pro) deacylase)
MMDERVKRVSDFIQSNSIKAEIIEFDTSTKNSQLAAQALNCPVGQIAKSIVFTGDRPVIVILSGDKRVDVKKLSDILGSPASLSDAATVLRLTGFPVGGVPPFGHAHPARVLIDSSLERFDEVYAAAGAPNAIVRIRLQDLKTSSRAELVHVSE